MRLGDSHVNAAVTIVFGAAGAKVFLIFVIISVLGTLNGFTLGSLRMPYSLAIRGMFPASEKVAYIEEGHHIPKVSAKIAFVLGIIWSVLNYVAQKYNMIPNSDVGVIRGVIIPIIAILGSLMIVIGGLQNPMTLIYLGICLITILVALVYIIKIDKRL